MPLSAALKALPKAELHVHLEGTATPALVKKLAARHSVSLPAEIFADETTYAWSHFNHFLTVYDAASSVIRTPEDYRDVTWDYLRQCHEDGAIYVEMFSSPDHAAMNGMSFKDHLDGISAGIADAERDFGIVGRIIVTCVSHFGAEKAVEVARETARHVGHPHLVGFGMGGNEVDFRRSDYAPAFTIAHEAGLPCTVHAGETGGPEVVRNAIDNLPVKRIGHGVQSIFDADLVRRLADERIVLEVCPTSNVLIIDKFPTYADHPFLKLREAGVIVTLNSDDPPFFRASIGGEYAVAEREFGLDEPALRGITRNALEAAFCDEATKARLLAKL
ncbi:adenosine deaminase [Radicibacter daui]|uniref:adenosine deaminase n=1 Tax=Radicibacter daui TaxID=3064829 RepID=UPI0040468F91